MMSKEQNINFTLENLASTKIRADVSILYIA